MQTKIIAMGVTLFLVGITSLDNYQQRGKVSELRIKIEQLKSKLNKQEEVFTAKIKEQAAHFANTALNIPPP